MIAQIKKKFPRRLPEKGLLFSNNGNNVIIKPPLNPNIMPNSFCEESLSLKKIKRIIAVTNGTATYKTEPILPDVNFMPRTKKITLSEANNEMGVISFIYDNVMCFCRNNNGRITSDAVVIRSIANVKGGISATPFLVKAADAALRSAPKITAINAIFLALILFVACIFQRKIFGII